MDYSQWIALAAYSTVLILLILQCFLCRKEPGTRPEDLDMIYRLFYRPALKLRRHELQKRQNRSGGVPPHERKLLEQYLRLSPRHAMDQVEQHMVRIYSGSLCLAALGCTLGLLLLLSQLQNRQLMDGQWVLRNPYQYPPSHLELEAIHEEEKELVSLEISSRQYTKEQLEALAAQALAALPGIILADNPSPDQISQDLYLPSELPNYPFLLSWRMDRYDLIHTDGRVFPELLPQEENSHPVILTLRMNAGTQVWEQEFPIVICRPILTPEEQFSQDLQRALLQQDSATASGQTFQLPSQINGIPLSWKEPLSLIHLAAPMACLVLALLQILLSRGEAEKKLRDRSSALLICYPDFITRLVLLMGAGMPARSAFFQIRADYSTRRDPLCSYLAAELSIACREMESGITEVEAYERFGRRCGLSQYRKCMTLLVQNLKKGSPHLLQILREEAQRSFKDRRDNALKLGEKAQTKLLFPMMIMLLVALLLIILPAWLSFTT